MIKKVYISDKEKRKRFKDKFAYNPWTGVRKLTATGCMGKFDLTREEMHLSEKESKIRNWEMRNRTEYEEDRMLCMLSNCFELGYKLLPNESAEQLIERVREDGMDI